MKVRELIEALQEFDSNYKVEIAKYEGGEYPHQGHWEYYTIDNFDCKNKILLIEVS